MRSSPRSTCFSVVLAVLVPLFSFSCRTTPTEVPIETPIATSAVYVVNEGNFMRGNSTLTVYLPDSGKAYQDVFSAANGRPLGDTGNDIVTHSGKAYIVVSGSQRIEVISLSDYKSVGTLIVPGQRDPYRLAIVNEAKAYVTNLSDTSVTVFNPSTLQIITDRIRVGKNPQGVATVNGKIYVCNSGFGYDSTITVLNASTGALIRTIFVGMSPSEVGIGPNNQVVVKCDGRSDWVNPAKDSEGSISLINADNDVIIQKVFLPLVTYGHPGRMSVSSKGYGFFQGKTGVIKFTFAGSGMNVSGTPFVAVSAYSLTLDDMKDQLYVTDAKDYTQPGEVTIFDSQAIQIARFSAGIIPGAIAFKR